MERRKCLGGCGRWLKSPTALARGYGRVCWERLDLKPEQLPPTPAPRPTARSGADVAHCPGQTALPLIPFQPTLESL
jgi:hypothetical protein